VHEVAAVVFQYIGMLQREGISERVWLEEQAIAAMSFRFQEKGEPASSASRFAGWMQEYPPAETFTGAYLFSEYDKSLLEVAQGALTVDSCMMSIQAKELEAQTTEEERWYKTKYSAAPTDEAVLSTFRAKFEGMLAGADAARPDLFLPKENPFIPTNFDIKPDPSEPAAVPMKIEESPLLSLWHKQDVTFKKPRGVLYVDMSTPVAYYSPTNAVQTRLFTKMVEDALNEFAYEAQVAGLYYGIYMTSAGLRMELTGYDDKLCTLLEAICAKMAAFDDWADQQRFDLLKEQVRELRPTLPPF
jgi:insulysin